MSSTMDKVRTVTLAGKQVGRIGYGAMGLTSNDPKLPDWEDGIAAIKTAVDAGSTFINSGAFYGKHEPLDNLRMLGMFYTKYPEYIDKTVLSVKGGVNMKTYEVFGDLEKLRSEIKSVNEVLGGKTIDIWETGRLPPGMTIEELMTSLKTLRDEGLFTHIGLSEVKATTLRKALKIAPVVAVELEVSLWCLEEDILECVKTCKELNIPVVAYSPLGRGILTGGLRSLDGLHEADWRRHTPAFQGDNFKTSLALADKVGEIAKAKGVSNSQLAIAYILKLYPGAIPIPGSTKPERILDNARAIDVDLTDDDLKSIDEILSKFGKTGDRYGDRKLLMQ